MVETQRTKLYEPPTAYGGGPRPKDWVKCADPECAVHKDIAEYTRRWPNVVRNPNHCHPVF